MKALPYYKEEWKDIEGFEGVYQVSNFIKVLNVITGKLKKFSFDSHGYLTVRLWKNNSSKLYLVHRLIAEAFIPNPENKYCVDHINTFKTDNRVENLKWVNHKENQNNPLTKHHISNGLKGKLINRKDLSKPIYRYSFNNELIEIYPSISEASRQLNIDASCICACLKGKTKYCCNSYWYYSPSSSLLSSGSGVGSGSGSGLS